MGKDTINKAAIDVGGFIHRLGEGYYAYAAAITILREPKAIDLIPPVESGQSVPVGHIAGKFGGGHFYHFPYYLEQARTNTLITSEMDRVWCVGSLLAISDMLEKYKYFDRNPQLELIRHLRNGVAHGNVFRITDKRNLEKYPARMRIESIERNHPTIYEIKTELNGRQVLFDFIDLADLISAFFFVGSYLLDFGNGKLQSR